MDCIMRASKARSSALVAAAWPSPSPQSAAPPASAKLYDASGTSSFESVSPGSALLFADVLASPAAWRADAGG
eukprot:5560686-Pleurochrysis_carterae.AAC.1